uniref:Protein containing His-binding domain n=1 Tax=Rhipicephalus zambeziensis TaxID=60191 RepID=A0A224YEW8_9ACAR
MGGLLGSPVQCVYSTYVAQEEKAKAYRRTLIFLRTDGSRKTLTTWNLRLEVSQEGTKPARIEATKEPNNSQVQLKQRPIFTVIVIFADSRCLVLKDDTSVNSKACYMWSTGGRNKKPSSYCQYIYLAQCTEMVIVGYNTTTCADQNGINRSS